MENFLEAKMYTPWLKEWKKREEMSRNRHEYLFEDQTKHQWRRVSHQWKSFRHPLIIIHRWWGELIVILVSGKECWCVYWSLVLQDYGNISLMLSNGDRAGLAYHTHDCVSLFLVASVKCFWAHVPMCKSLHVCALCCLHNQGQCTRDLVIITHCKDIFSLNLFWKGMLLAISIGWALEDQACKLSKLS